MQDVHSPHRRTIVFVHAVQNFGQTALEDVRVTVAIPRSDERQRIHSLRFTPEPVAITADGWGQETASFVIDRIGPCSRAEVHLEVDATVEAIDWLVTERDVGARSEIPERVARHYLRDGANYHLGGESLRRAAAALRQEGSSVLEDVRRIHDFVIDSLEYDRDDRWDPADRVLCQRHGSCSEYAYLMIALCRLSGIPARYAGGTWIESAEPERESTQTGEPYVDRVFHRWVEVYLPRVGWFPVDPTRDDAAEKQGRPYLYFGSLPWSYLTMTHGDGDVLESGALGWEYRSSAQWRSRKPVLSTDVSSLRYASWSSPELRVALAGHDPATGAAPGATFPLSAPGTLASSTRS